MPLVPDRAGVEEHLPVCRLWVVPLLMQGVGPSFPT